MSRYSGEYKAIALDWLDEFADDIAIHRDLTKGVRVELTFCHKKTGCPVTVNATSLLGAVRAARLVEGKNFK